MFIKKYFIVLFVLFMAVACSHGPKIHTNFDETIDFKQYKKFAFFKQLDTDHRYQTLVSQHLKKATTDEMQKRGYVLDQANPELLINFNTNVENKQSVQQVPSTMGMGYYGYRGRYYYNAWPSYETHIDNYQEGTVNIDLVDKKQNKMIWEGVAVGRLNKEIRQNTLPVLEKVVSEIFAKFPVKVVPSSK